MSTGSAEKELFEALARLRQAIDEESEGSAGWQSALDAYTVRAAAVAEAWRAAGTGATPDTSDVVEANERLLAWARQELASTGEELLRIREVRGRIKRGQDRKNEPRFVSRTA